MLIFALDFARDQLREEEEKKRNKNCHIFVHLRGHSSTMRFPTLVRSLRVIFNPDRASFSNFLNVGNFLKL